VGLSVDLGYTNLTVKDFLNLKEGDIIVLDNDYDKQLLAMVEGIGLFEGFAGRYKNKKVFKVEDQVKLDS
jgi:flagellar motor switch protein FliM